MNKAASFRQAIALAVPSLKDDPDRLLVFIDQGHIVATAAPSLSFEYRFVLNAILLDFAGDADTVFVALMAWVHRHQSDLVSNDDTRKNGITFEVDHLTQTTFDLSIKLTLTESVVVGTDPAGAQTITHVDEPVNEWNLDSFVGL
jgi:P2 phage tail completion protein R (GpR)